MQPRMLKPPINSHHQLTKVVRISMLSQPVKMLHWSIASPCIWRGDLEALKHAEVMGSNHVCCLYMADGGLANVMRQEHNAHNRWWKPTDIASSVQFICFGRGSTDASAAMGKSDIQGANWCVMIPVWGKGSCQWTAWTLHLLFCRVWRLLEPSAEPNYSKALVSALPEP